MMNSLRARQNEQSHYGAIVGVTQSRSNCFLFQLLWRSTVCVCENVCVCVWVIGWGRAQVTQRLWKLHTDARSIVAAYYCILQSSVNNKQRSKGPGSWTIINQYYTLWCSLTPGPAHRGSGLYKHKEVGKLHGSILPAGQRVRYLQLTTQTRKAKSLFQTRMICLHSKLKSVFYNPSTKHSNNLLHFNFAHN